MRITLVNADGLEKMLSMPENSVDLILTDPPYKKEFNHLYGKLSEMSAKVLKDGGVMAVMCGQSYLLELIADMSKHLIYRWTIAYLTPGGQACQIWQRRVITFWKPVFLFSKGFHNKDWFGDVAKSPTNNNDKKHHKWGQSEAGMVDLLKRLSKKDSDVVLDPFMGAGTTGIACKIVGRQFIGVEISQEYYKIAEDRLTEECPDCKVYGVHDICPTCSGTGRV